MVEWLAHVGEGCFGWISDLIGTASPKEKVYCENCRHFSKGFAGSEEFHECYAVTYHWDTYLRVQHAHPHPRSINRRNNCSMFEPKEGSSHG